MPARRAGLTLLELILVLFILVILAALVVPIVTSSTQNTELDVTFQTMQRLRDAIMGGHGNNVGYFNDMKGLPIPGRSAHGLPMPPDPSFPHIMSLADLLRQPAGAQDYNVQTQRGWRGPYISQGISGTTLEIWDSFPNGGQAGSPILIQWPPPTMTDRERYVRLVSLGANGAPGPATTPATAVWLPSSLNATNWDDDIIVYVRRDLPGMDWTNYWSQKNILAH